MSVDGKTQKYDRQLRLWHEHGQHALTSASVCVVNAAATAAETLKNLVLAGVGQFTLIDAAAVSLLDSANNFFVTATSVGHSRARVVTELLAELNEDVDGHFVEEDLDSLLLRNPAFFLSFSVVLVTGWLPESTALALANVCWNAPRNVPLIIVRNVGFVAQVSIYVKEHTVIEVHPDNTKDLRLDSPWPELSQYIDTLPPFEEMDSLVYAHVPYVCILLRLLKLWQIKNEKPLPLTSTEKTNFRTLVASCVRHNALDNENWDEAIANAYNVYNHSGRVTNELKMIFDDVKCTEELTPNSKLDTFWIVARAVKAFVANEGHGNCPLGGKLPDMKADTESYIKLQTIYRQKAQSDYRAVKAHVQTVLNKLARPMDSAIDVEIEAFCKNAQYVRVIRTNSLEQELVTSRAEFAHRLQDPDDLFVLHVLFRAYDIFFTTYKRYPDTQSPHHASTAGEHPEDVDSDFSLLKGCVRRVLQQMELGSANGAGVIDDWISEFTRAGTAELHNMAALIGGVVSQEMIKLITRQYAPMRNTFLFNGIKSTSTVMEL